MSVRSNSLLHPNPSHACFLPAPDFGSCGPCCEPVCEPKCCPPKARARDAIHMRPREIARRFTLKELGCGGDLIPPANIALSMTLRRRGACRELVCIPPSGATLDGAVEFMWPDAFLCQDPGQYEGDICVNGNEVGTVLLVKPDRTAIITSNGVTEEGFGCAGCGQPTASCGCGSTCASLPDLIEEPIPATDENCEGCEPC